MANGKRGQVELRLGETTHLLTFDYNALCELEERMGTSVDELFFGGGVSHRALREAVCVGIKSSRTRRVITPKQVGRMIADELESNEKGMLNIVSTVLNGILLARGSNQKEIDEMLEDVRVELDDDYEPPARKDGNGSAKARSEDDDEPRPFASTTGTS